MEEEVLLPPADTGPWSSGELNALIGDYGKRLICSLPEGRGTALMELTEKVFDLHVRPCFDGIQNEGDRNRFLFGLERNAPFWFRHNLAPILSEPDKQTAENCLNIILSKWRAKAYSIAITPVKQPASEADQVGQCERSWGDIQILFETDLSVQISGPGITTHRCNFEQFGFADGRDGNPDDAWTTLHEIAEGRGNLFEVKEKCGRPRKTPQDGYNSQIPIESRTQIPKTQIAKRIQKVRKVLKEYFRIQSDPVECIRGSGYRANFKVGLLSDRFR